MKDNGDLGASDRLDNLLSRVGAEVRAGSLTPSSWDLFREELQRAVLDLAGSIASVSAAEGDHKLKNLMEAAILVASEVRTSTAGADEFSSEMRRRILLFGSAVTEAARPHDASVSLRSLFGGAVNAVSGDVRAGSLRLEGPDILVGGRDAIGLRLAAQELAVNAFKHGALRDQGDNVNVSWETTSAPTGATISILWEEVCTRQVREPERLGSGSDLLSSRLKDIAGIEVTSTFRPHGLVCRIRVGRKPAILVVDDYPMILMGLEATFKAIGYEVKAVASEPEALAFLRNRRPDVAVLDRDLGSGFSFPVADVLAGMRVPFVFMTGVTEAEGGDWGGHRGVPVVVKGDGGAELKKLVARMLETGASTGNALAHTEAS